jgi:TolA-binding protein
VARLLGKERRMQLADVYLGLSQKALERDPADQKAALEFLDLAMALQLPEDERLRLLERSAKLAFDMQDWGQAARRYSDLVVARRGKVMGEGNGVAAHAERFWLAQAWRRSGNPVQAQRLIEDLLREGLGDELAPEARFELALCHNVPNRGPELARGIDRLQDFLSKHGTHKRAPKASYLLAQSQTNLGRMTDALATLETLLERYADSKDEVLPDAAADRAVVLTRLERFDDAVAAWRSYLSSYPAHGRWMQAQREIVNLAYQKADKLRAKGKEHYDEAVKLYLAFLEENPLDGRAAAIHLQIAKMRQEQERYEDAKVAYERCAEKYPQHASGLGVALPDRASARGQALQLRAGDPGLREGQRPLRRLCAAAHRDPAAQEPHARDRASLHERRKAPRQSHDAQPREAARPGLQARSRELLSRHAGARFDRLPRGRGHRAGQDLRVPDAGLRQASGERTRAQSALRRAGRLCRQGRRRRARGDDARPRQ